MTAHPFRTDPWLLVEDPVDLDGLGLTEALLSLSNGVIGLRGGLEEQRPAVTPGVFLAGLREDFPLTYPEPSYGDPETGQALVNVPDGLRLWVTVAGDDLDTRTGEIHRHRRCLDMRDGVLTRELDWTSPGGARILLRTARLASLRVPSLAAVLHEVTAPEGGVELTVVSDLTANDSSPVVASTDPQVERALARPFTGRRHLDRADGGILVHATHGSGLLVGSGCAHGVVVVRPDGSEERIDPRVEVTEDRVRVTVDVTLAPGERLRILKALAYERDDDTGAPGEAGVARAVQSVLDDAAQVGWEALHAENRRHLEEFWSVARVDVAGDPELEQALRFAVLAAYQSAALVEDAPIGAKGLTGGGYSGHTFWDIEGLLVPLLTLLCPRSAEAVLRWRASTLDVARERARLLGLQGAAFPWRTIDGHEASGYWPASSAAMHVQADIARAMDLYRHVRGELEFERVHGLEVLVETARLWMSRGHTDAEGAWHVYGVTGPDEYTAIVDDNVFTNLMAARNLRAAVESCGRHPDRAEELGVKEDELATWRAAAEGVHVLRDADLGIHPASAGFTGKPEWDFVAWGDRYPVQEHAPYSEIYRHQVIKQADLVNALWWCGDDFEDDDLARDLDYYERRTVRDSSLSASVQSVVCIQAGHLELGLDYLREAARVDLRDLQGNTELGLHLASLAGAWLALAAGLGGLREDADQPQLSPRLPDGLDGYSFGFRWLDGAVRVTVGEDVRVEVTGLDRLDLVVYGSPVRISPDEPAVIPLTRVDPLLPTPTQPPGRSPREVADA